MAEVKPVQLSQYMVTQQSAPVEQEKPAEKKSLSTPQKAMIGLAVLGATIAAGLGIRHGINVKNFNKEYDKLYGRISGAIDLHKKWEHPEWFDYDALTARFNQAAQQAKESRNLDHIRFYDEFISECRGVFNNRGFVLENLGESIDINKFDTHIKAILEQAEKSKSAEVLSGLNSDLSDYRRFMNSTKDGAPQIIDGDYFKSLDAARLLEAKNEEALMKANSTVGKTIAESVEKTFGENSGITPHTYDLTKECEEILILRNCADSPGFSHSYIYRSGKLEPPTGALYGVPSGVSSELRKTFNDGNVVLEQMAHNGKKLLNLEIPAYFDTAGKPVYCGFTLESVGGNLTPAQQDLIKAAEKLNDKDLARIREAIGQGAASGYHYRKNYDALLSLIQTIANRA